MVKHVLLKLDNETFFGLKDLKLFYAKVNDKNVTWEQFFVEFNMIFYNRWKEIGLDKAIDEMAEKYLKREFREGFKGWAREQAKSLVARYGKC
jgi:hypothetical protein